MMLTRKPVGLAASAVAALLVLSTFAVPARGQLEGPATAPSTQPAEAPAPANKKLGTISGSVLTHDNQPAAEFPFRLVEEQPIGLGSGPRGNKLTIKFTTDKDGKFEVTDIKPSLYKIIGGNKDTGWVYYDIEILPGQHEKLELKLVKVGGGQQ
jgi:hypothetical protein